MQAISAFKDSALASAANEAFRWWLSELAGMVPERFRHRNGAVPEARIVISRTATAFDRIGRDVGERFVDDRALEDLDDEGWQELASMMVGTRASLVLKSPDCYTTHIILPKAARSRLRAAVALQLPQIAPLDPTMLIWNAQVTAQDDREITVRVVMARASRIDELQTLFENNGIAAPPIAADTPDRPIRLAAGHDHSVSAEARINRRAWTIAGAIIATIPLTLIAGAALLTSSTRGRMEALQKELNPRIAAEGRARHAEELRRALRPLFQRSPVSDTLEELAIRLPATSFLQAAKQGNDRRLMLLVNSAVPDDLEPAFAGARTLPKLEMTDQVAAENGRMLLQYRSSPQ